MKKIRFFQCETTGATFERFVKDNVSALPCACGGNAKKCLSAPKVKGNTTGASPSFSRNKY